MKWWSLFPHWPISTAPLLLTNQLGFTPRVHRFFSQTAFFGRLFHGIWYGQNLLICWFVKYRSFPVGGFKHFLFSISYMGCSLSHWRTHIFQDGYCTTNQFWVFRWAKNLAINGASTNQRQEKQSEELRELDRKFEEPMDFSFIQLWSTY